MAFDPETLDVLANTSRGYTEWRYETPDPLEDVLAAYYFNPAAYLLRRGDRIKLGAGWGATLETHGDLIVLDVGTRAGDQSPYVRVTGLILVQG